MKLRIDYYDNRHYADITGSCGCWDYSKLIPYIEEDIEKLHGELCKRFLRVKDYELLDIRLRYHIGIIAVIEGILEELAATDTFRNALSDVFDDEVIVLYGAYLDQAEVITTIKRED